MANPEADMTLAVVVAVDLIESAALRSYFKLQYLTAVKQT